MPRRKQGVLYRQQRNSFSEKQHPRTLEGQVNQRRRAGKLSHFFTDDSSNRDQAYTHTHKKKRKKKPSQKTGSPHARTRIYSSIKHGPKAGFQEALLGRGGGQKVARCEVKLRRLWGVPGPKCLINNGNARTQASAHLSHPPFVKRLSAGLQRRMRAKKPASGVAAPLAGRC